MRQVESIGLKGAWASIVIFALCSALTLPLALRARRPGGGDAGNLLIMGLMSGAALSAAERWADCDALIVRHQNVRWTYRDLQGRVDAFAAGLLAPGLQPGDRIGIWSPNNSE